MSTVLKTISSLLLFAGVLFTPVLNADDKAIQPVIPKGKGDQCVADTDFMRRNHMDVLNHDRDLTMYKGLRDVDFSLKGCIECHAVNDEQGQAITVKDERHFCRSCHDFAAVTVDCFQCHASRPTDKKKMSEKMADMPKDHIHKNLTKGDANP